MSEHTAWSSDIPRLKLRADDLLDTPSIDGHDDTPRLSLGSSPR
jgi:hypothetical protein